MEENNTQIISLTKTEKRLKRENFNFLDSGIACAAFIVFVLVFDLFYKVMPTVIKGNLIGSIVLSLLAEAVFGFAVWFTAGTRRVNFVKATKMNKRVDFYSVLLAIAISLISLTCFGYLTNVFVAFLNKIGYTSSSGQILIPNFTTYFLYVLLICVAPAFFEDFLFRGTILSGLREKLGIHKSVILSALFFMLMHGGPDQTIHQFILGVVLGYAFVASGSLWIPVIIHFVNNFTAVTIQFINDFGKTAEDLVVSQTSQTLSWGQIGINLCFALIMAFGGFVLCSLCLKRINKLREKREIKQKEKQVETEFSSEENLETQSLTLNIKKNETDRKNKKYAIILFSASIAYLVLDWVLALVLGFVL